MVNKLKGCFLHTHDDWATPSDIYKYYMDNGYIDPCPLHSLDDCLVKTYESCKLFVNPPYSNLNNFATWCVDQVNHNCVVDLLVPSRTDTKWFHYLLHNCNVSITFIKGRLKFGGSKYGAPFPSIIIHLERKHEVKN